MSWETIVVIAVIVWLVGLVVLVAVLRATSRGDAMVDADERELRERAERAAQEQEPQRFVVGEEQPRPRWRRESAQERAERERQEDAAGDERRRPG